MKTRKIIVMITTLCMLLSLGTTSLVYADNISQIIGDGNTVVFVDVPSNYWAKDQIDYFTQQGIVAGYEDGSFQPEAGVTREEFCKLLVSTFKQPLETPDTPTFADVAENRWSYPYIEVCKDYLTAYFNPFGGLPMFHPNENAKREDIAVALVRMMGFTDSDASDKNYASWKFRDGSSISPSLLPYVSLACEKGLISGYPNGTFGPTQGITRAETVVLLNRATKQAMTDINAELEISANVIYSQDGKTATINIIAQEGTTVTVNGETVKMSSNYYDEYEGNYVYKFENEGSKDFAIEGKRAGKTKSINLTAKYEIGVPALSVTSCPTTSDTTTVKISGTVSDINDEAPFVTVNGKTATKDYSTSKNWYYTVTLTEGDNNYTIIATNSAGKSTTIEKTITFGVCAPTLNVTSCPATFDTTTVKISGTVSDINDEAPVVTVNGKTATKDYSTSKNWYYTATLTEGNNEFTIVATNNLGKSTTVQKAISFGVSAPVLNVTSCPNSSETATVKISGTVSDINDDAPIVTVNGKTATKDYSTSKNWYYTATLTEGNNIFTITATNKLGKSTMEERKIEFSVSAPEIQFINCPSTTSKDSITIKGKIKGGNTGAMLFIDDEETYVNYDGEFSETVNLKEGANSFEFRAVNDYGKEVTVTKTITYTAE